MNREPKETPVEPWQWFSGCIFHLGKSRVIKIWNIGERAVEMWSADPRTTDNISRSPLTRIGHMLELLMSTGRVDHARYGVEYLAKIVRCTLIPDDEECVPDKATLEEELLDNYEALAAYTVAARDPEISPARKRELGRAAIDEIKQDMALLKD